LLEALVVEVDWFTVPVILFELASQTYEFVLAAFE
jgi:hypothetical protein